MVPLVPRTILCCRQSPRVNLLRNPVMNLPRSSTSPSLLPSYFPSDTPSNLPSSFPSETPSSLPSSVSTDDTTSVNRTNNENNNSNNETAITQPPPAPLQYGLQTDCNESNPNTFHICLDIATDNNNNDSGSDSDSQEWLLDALQAAQGRLERIIAADPSPQGWPATKIQLLRDRDVATTKPLHAIDDLYVSVVLQDLNNTLLLATANPTLFGYNVTRGGWQVAAGILRLNRARLDYLQAASYLGDLLLHELAHILGIGILWNEYNLINERQEYTGAMALQAWRDLKCSGALPVDGLHWKERCLMHEIMNPSFGENRTNLFSNISLGTLQDLGYQVNFDEADIMTLDDLSADACAAWCPGATGGATRRHLRSQKAQPLLSKTVTIDVLQAAATHFRANSMVPSFSPSSIPLTLPNPPQAVSIVHEVNGYFYSRIVHKHEVDHLS